MTPEEHKRRGDAADALFREMKRQARSRLAIISPSWRTTVILKETTRARKFAFLAVALVPTLHVMGCETAPTRDVGIVRGFLSGPRLPSYGMDYTLPSSPYYGDVGIVRGFLSGPRS